MEIINVYLCNEDEHELEPNFLSKETFYECKKCPFYTHQYVECDGI